MPWIDACAVDEIDEEDVIRWDHADGRTFAIYHGADGAFYCTDGLVMDNEIECPKHNGLFDYRTGKALRAPVCVNLGTYPAKAEGGRVLVLIE